MKAAINKSYITIIICLVLFLFISFPEFSSAKPFSASGQIILLAVSESSSENKGSTADLSLEIKEGSGKIYLDTFPLSKIDTQLSTRFARDYACNYLQIDCNKLDFFYTIRSESLIIGGPSAGAAATVLSVAVLDNKKIDNSIAMTGTINSGGFVGAVGGLKAKIKTGAENGLKTILIPKGSRYFLDKDNLKFNETNNQINISETNIPNYNISNLTIQNLTIDLYEYGKENGIIVKEILTIEESLLEFTGYNYGKEIKEITLDPFYLLTMKNIASDLCGRTEKLNKELENNLNNTINDNNNNNDNNSSRVNAIIEETKQLINRSNNAIIINQFYAAASYCFGANININTLIFQTKYSLKQQQLEKLDELLNATLKVKISLEENQLKTITDLQAYIVVKERLVEAEELITKTTDFIKQINDSEQNNSDPSYQIAFATERLYSAYLWSSFFSHHGKNFNLDNDVLRTGCVKKLSEAEELLQYLQLTFPFEITDITSQIKKTHFYLENNKFKECLSEASKTKADIDVILSTSGVNAEQLKDLLDVKIKLIKQNIGKQQEKEIFPIIGYSYYEYAQSLAEKDIISALIYAEYAIEFSNIEIYLENGKSLQKQFNKLEQIKDYFDIDLDMVLIFAVGIFIGIILASKNARETI